MSLFSRMSTCVTLVILAIRATPGKLRSRTHSRLLVNTYAYSVRARSSSACSAAALSPPDGPVTTASMPRQGAQQVALARARIAEQKQVLLAIEEAAVHQRLQLSSGLDGSTLQVEVCH